MLHYLTFLKIKDTLSLRTFQPENYKKLRTSETEKKFAGPYKKKSVRLRRPLMSLTTLISLRASDLKAAS